MTSTQPDLHADCSRCAGLCCVALAFARSADFGFDKPAGEPCVHLAEDFGCGIHPRLRESGFSGCTVFECFGAGQQVTQLTFGGRDWRHAPESSRLMFDVFAVMRQLHELLFHLVAARALSDLPEVAALSIEVTDLTAQSPEAILAADVEDLQRRGHRLLGQVSQHVRSAAGLGANARRGASHSGAKRAGRDLRGADLRGASLSGAKRAGADLRGADLRGADLIGAKRAGADLRGADLRGAYLIAADLRGADLRWADLIGADLRDADLTGADLRDADLTGADLGDALFLTQPQLDSARGDAATMLPSGLQRPVHWSVD